MRDEDAAEIVELLAAHECACAACGAALRGARTPECPQCGRRVRLLEAYLASHDLACARCGYALRGVRDVCCPECGEVIPRPPRRASDQTEGQNSPLQQLARAVPRPLVIAALVGLGLLALEIVGEIAVRRNILPARLGAARSIGRVVGSAVFLAVPAGVCILWWARSVSTGIPRAWSRARVGVFLVLAALSVLVGVVVAWG